MFLSIISVKFPFCKPAFLFINLKLFSETFLNSDTAFDDDSLKIERNNIARSDHHFNSRRGGVCLYYNQSLAWKILDIKYLQECIVFQVLIANKLCNFFSLYRSPSQPTNIFDQFADNLELTLDELANHNPFLIVVLENRKLVQT